MSPEGEHTFCYRWKPLERLA